jgi:hypothetical protein
MWLFYKFNLYQIKFLYFAVEYKEKFTKNILAQLKTNTIPLDKYSCDVFYKELMYLGKFIIAKR